MEEMFERSKKIFGKEAIEKLEKSKVAIFGLGGVGSYVVEGLARGGIGHFLLVDFDKYDITNINRQLCATIDSIGKYKTKVEKERILSINPKAVVETSEEFYLEQENLLDGSFDYVIDAIDSIKSKIAIIKNAKKLNIPVISAMGTGNKVDPTKFEITDISKTKVCPLAKIMRKELKKEGINNVKVIYSTEEPINLKNSSNINEKNILGSVSFVPSVAGLMISGEVIKNIVKK